MTTNSLSAVAEADIAEFVSAIDFFLPRLREWDARGCVQAGRLQTAGVLGCFWARASDSPLKGC